MATKSSWIPLSQLCEAIVDCEHKTAPVQDSGIPSIRTTNIKNGRLDLENANLVSEETYKLWTARLEPQPNDLILAREAPVGEVGIVPRGKRVCLGQRTVLIRPDGKKLFPRYLLYLLLTPEMRHEMTCRAEGSVVPHLNMSDIRNFEIPPPPPLDEQKAIAHILGTLDDKIELNQQMNRTLEAIARAIFKSWFIDFDPVRAKMDGRQPVGMDAEMAVLFPDEFEDSPLGQIPKGWTYQAANCIANIGIGKTPPRKEQAWFSLNLKNIRWVSIRDMGASGVFIRKTKEYLIPDALHKFSIKIVPDNTVLLSFKLTIGRVVLTDGEMVTNEAIAHFKLPVYTPFSSEYLYLYLEKFDYNQLGNTSSIAQAVNSKIIKEMPILNPGADILNTFSCRIASIFRKIKQTQQESETLSSIRDTLLPKLLSGEIRVKDAEKVLEEVV
ncbi:restriction modification system DNA specificity domain [Limnospira maxima CS-328]|uniref:Restriction modification system DNA specificity domain n=1 Tax=Limnospira maxima CS-328 TaxID=513049 RepID=B5W7D4_LIMMA|nr:restriction endonuclease subunit S [Limnospira maxima]EDZ92555.1 restriction modification system DNA specificity domain [Limnospira maxima CS-328]MDC0840017.1 restriction endonuclease subunit S [Limnoraphis robusta]